MMIAINTGSFLLNSSSYNCLDKTFTEVSQIMLSFSSYAVSVHKLMLQRKAAILLGKLRKLQFAPTKNSR